MTVYAVYKHARSERYQAQDITNVDDKMVSKALNMNRKELGFGKNGVSIKWWKVEAESPEEAIEKAIDLQTERRLGQGLLSPNSKLMQRRSEGKRER